MLNNEAFHYPNQWFGERSAVLEFATEIDGITVNGIDMITWDDHDRITHFKVMIRPLKAINLVHEKMRETLMAISRHGFTSTTSTCAVGVPVFDRR